MLPNDNQYYDPSEDSPEPLNPTVVAYLKAKQDAQAARDAGNQQGQTQDMIGAGVDVASALVNRPSKQAVYLQHYNDTSAPKLTQGYKPHSNGDSERAAGDKARAAGQAKGAQIGADFDNENKVTNQVRQQGREDVLDDRATTEFDHKQARQPGVDAAEDAKNAAAQAGYDDATESRDPNSQKSQDFRKFVGTVAPDLAAGLGNMSYEAAAKSVPSMVNAYELRKSREQVASDKLGTKSEAADDKAVTAMKDDLDPNKGRGGNLAKNQAQIDQADRLKGLYTEANGDIRNLDSRQMEEMAIGMNKMLSGSSGGSVTQVQALLPHTIVGNAQKLKEWLMNDPQGANQKAFVQRMAETVEREREIATNQVRTAQVQRLSAHQKLKQTNPEAYSRVLHAYGIEDSDVDTSGKFVTPKHGKDTPQNAPQTDKPAWAK